MLPGESLIFSCTRERKLPETEGSSMAWRNQELCTSSRKDLFLGDSQVRLLLWLLVEIMLLYLLTKHLGLVT